MIDWWNVFTNSLWIVGLAVALAIFGYRDWLASHRGEGLGAATKQVIQEPVFILGLAVASLGVGLGVAELWTRILWLALAAGLVLEARWTYVSRKKDLSP